MIFVGVPEAMGCHAHRGDGLILSTQNTASYQGREILELREWRPPWPLSMGFLESTVL